MKNRHLQYWIIELTKHLPKTILSNLVIIYWSKIVLKPYKRIILVRSWQFNKEDINLLAIYTVQMAFN